MENLSFDRLPKEVAQLRQDFNRFRDLFESKQNEYQDRWFDLNELVEYDPEKRSKATFYGYTHNPNSDFPFHKRGKKIIVLKSEFDQWLKTGKRKTITEEVDVLLGKK